MQISLPKKLMFDPSDYQNMHAAISLATVMLKAEDLPEAATQVTNIAKASKNEYTLTDKDRQALIDYITKALQSQTAIPSRTFDAGIIGTLGKLVKKLQDVEGKNIDDQ